MKDVDIVRWAFVRVLAAEPDYLDPDYDGDRHALAKNLHADLISATPERLLWLLHIEDLEFAQRVHRLVADNEVSRK
jgi:hypothetical protein